MYTFLAFIRTTYCALNVHVQQDQACRRVPADGSCIMHFTQTSRPYEVNTGKVRIQYAL